MKVKIKRTGEVFNVYHDAKIELDHCDDYGIPLTVSIKDVEIIQETSEDEHWQNLMERAAIAIMQGLLSNQIKAGNTDQYAKAAVGFADALIEELKRNSHETA